MTNSREPEVQELLLAYVEGVEDPGRLMQVLLTCEDEDSAVDALQLEYGWNEIQARAVLDVQFRRVTQKNRRLLRRQLEGED